MNIFKRFSAVQAAMSKVGIDKAGKNKMQNYNYRGIDQVMNTLAPVLAANEVLIIPSVANHNMTQGTTKSGGVSFHHCVEVEYMIVGPEGDKIGPFRSRGECIDTSDKGLNKACTAAYKYWVLTALCVPLEGQEDADSATPEPAEPVVGLTPEQMQELLGLCMASNTAVDEFVKWAGFPNMVSIPFAEFDRLVAALNKKLDVMNREYQAGETPQ
jgi:hypothetical protein